MPVSFRVRALGLAAVLLALPSALAGSSPSSPAQVVDVDDGVAPPPPPATPAARAYSPHAGRTYPTRVYFGDTHLHSSNSGDAFMAGDRLGPEQAYRFARGEEVAVSGQRFRLRRPLDWAAVTDHAEYLGEMETILQAGAPGHDDPISRELRGLTTMEERERWFLDFSKRNRSGKPEHLPFWQGPASTAAAWRRSVAASERQGMRVLAIPHNSNASKGRMFFDLTAARVPTASCRRWAPAWI